MPLILLITRFPFTVVPSRLVPFPLTITSPPISASLKVTFFTPSPIITFPLILPLIVTPSAETKIFPSTFSLYSPPDTIYFSAIFDKICANSALVIFAEGFNFPSLPETYPASTSAEILPFAQSAISLLSLKEERTSSFPSLKPRTLATRTNNSCLVISL